jgi:outer membrane protein assembly factor BamA
VIPWFPSKGQTQERSRARRLPSSSQRLLFLIVLGVLESLPLLAQTGPVHKPASSPVSESRRQLIAVKVTGSKRFPEAAVIAASGLQIGAIASDDDFKKASRHLGDTGAFSDIAYTFSYTSAGTKLEFHVSDADAFVPARFEDFVWFSDEELQRTLKERVPLFDGDLPLSGRLPEQVSDVLQAMLVEKGIPGHVRYERIHREDAHVEDSAVEAIDYLVSDVVIRVHKVDFIGAAPSELPLLESAARKLSGLEYSRDRFATLAEHDFLPAYHAHGYLKASFGPPQPYVVKADSDADEPRNLTLVDVALAVTPGAQYKLDHVEWTGNREIATDMLQSMVPLRRGEPANTVELADDLAAVKTLYGSRGYITTSIKPEAQYDEAAGTVVIRLNVIEGYIYRMGDLEFRGIDNSLTAKLRNAWKIRQGEVFDTTYLKQYLPVARRLLPPTLDWDIAPHVTANVRDKSVDVDLQLTVKAPK